MLASSSESSIVVNAIPAPSTPPPKPPVHQLVLNRRKSAVDVEADLFPQLKETQEKSQLIVNRLKIWKPFLADLHAFLMCYKDAHTHIQKEAHRFIGRSLRGNVENPLGTEEVLKNFSAAIGQLGKNHSDFAAAFDKNIIRLFDDLNSEYQRKSRDFSSRLERQFATLKTGRSSFAKAYETHLNSIDRRKGREPSDSLDPWLSEKAVNEQIVTVLSIESESNESIQKVHQEVQDFEKYIIVTLQKLIPALSTVNSHYAAAVQVSLKNMSTLCNRIDAGAAFKLYVDKHELGKHHQVSTAKQPADIQWKTEESNDADVIVKQGILGRPGTYRKSVFKPAYYVLTKHGFLHCFNMDNQKQPPEVILEKASHYLRYSINIRLPKLTIEKSATIANCIELGIPVHHMLFGTSVQIVQIKSFTEEDMESWLDALDQFLLKNRAPPTLQS